MPVAAYVLGARIVEKHFTLNRAIEGHRPPRSRSSRSACASSCATCSGRGSRSATGDKMPHPSEADPITKMGKKIVAARDAAGRAHVIRATTWR